jgi:nitrile hydratase subunit beta
MTGEESAISIGRLGVVKAQGEEPVFKAGDAVRISVRFPIGHFRVPT